MNLKSKIETLYYKVVIGVKNIIYYLPLIWNDRSWDYTYNYKFLRVKLEKQREHILKYSAHVNAKRDAREIFVCIQLLKRLEELEYDEVFWRNGSFRLPLSNKKVEFKKIDKLITSRKNQDIDLLATYLKKYAGGWWY